MKLLITSVDAIIDNETGTYFQGIKESLEYFEKVNEDNKVVIISIDNERLRKVPNDFYKLYIGNKWLRSSPRLIKLITDDTGIEYNDIFILGAKDSDMILAANAKLILLTADFAKKNNPEQRIYTEGYGIAIFSDARLKFFFDHFLSLSEPWFYSLEIDDQTKLYGLTDAMTNRQEDDDVRKICLKLKDFLKAGDDKYKNPFLIYALMSVYNIFKEVEDINYWGYYPSSTTNENVELKAFKEILRKSFKSSTSPADLLIRTSNSPQRKNMSEGDRIKYGCDSQFDSIILNPWFKGKISGKNVCIIDDFTNHGSSCETVRHLLKKAGVNKIIFISIGKFRYDYKKFDYEIEGDVYNAGKYSYKRNGTFELIRGNVNNESSMELLTSLKDLVS
ncbi:phosphoribosyltransferase [Flavobacterium sp. XS1P27]|uniref:phosphoribosyltransferase n=1 Tax=Flavobacterium sp. XS1P27 TaxID=3401724 RepID=UPI003AAA3516